MATAKTTNEQVHQLNPAELLTDDNIRYGLKKDRIQSLKEDVKNYGGIHTPITVEPLTKEEMANSNGFKYRVTDGHYRTELAKILNEEEGAGMTVPALIRPIGDPLKRLRLQISSNIERENQTPMDEAVAVHKLFQAQVPKAEIMQIFKKPTGKANRLQPASNSWINIMLSFMTFSKPIQEKIHDGRLTWSAAAELARAKPENREKILKDAETARLARIDKEIADETKFVEQERKQVETDQKREQAEQALAAAKNLAEETAATLLAKVEAAAEAYKKTIAPGIKAAERKVLTQNWRSLEAEKVQAQAVADKQQAELKKLQGSVMSDVERAQKLATAAAEKKKKAEADAAAKKAAAAQAPVTQTDIKQAAAVVEPENAKAVPRNLAEIRTIVNDLASLAGSYAIVQDIGKEFKSCFDGVQSARQLYTALSKITGEYEPPKPAPAAAPAKTVVPPRKAAAAKK